MCRRENLHVFTKMKTCFAGISTNYIAFDTIKVGWVQMVAVNKRVSILERSRFVSLRDSWIEKHNNSTGVSKHSRLVKLSLSPLMWPQNYCSRNVSMFYVLSLSFLLPTHSTFDIACWLRSACCYKGGLSSTYDVLAPATNRRQLAVKKFAHIVTTEKFCARDRIPTIGITSYKLKLFYSCDCYCFWAATVSDCLKIIAITLRSYIFADWKVPDGLSSGVVWWVSRRLIVDDARSTWRKVDQGRPDARSSEARAVN